jgi:hypothetical protein
MSVMSGFSFTAITSFICSFSLDSRCEYWLTYQLSREKSPTTENAQIICQSRF